MKMKHLKALSLLLALSLFFTPLPSVAEGDVLPSDVFLVIMLKALNYDRNIDRNAQGKVVIGVVFINGDGLAGDFAQKIRDNFAAIQSKSQLKSLPAEIRLLGFDKSPDKNSLEERLKQEHISSVVVAVQDEAFNRTIFEVTRSMGINSVCYSAACVKQGAGLGIVLKDNKPRMMVNLGAVKQEGSDYSAKFLALCEVVS